MESKLSKSCVYKGYLDGFSLDNEKICGWVKNNGNNNQIWISSSNSTLVYNIKCNKFRSDKYLNGEDPYCGFELQTEALTRKFKLHGKIFISFDKSKKHLLPGIKQPFDLPPKLFINFIEEIKKQIIKGNDLIPNKAAITFEKIRAFSGYYRHWFSTTKYNVQPNLYYPELSFFTLTKIKKSLNPFNTDVPNELRNCPLIKDFEKINNIKYCDKKTYEFYRDKLLLNAKTLIPEEIPPQFRQIIIDKSFKFVKDTSVIIPTWNRSLTILRAIDSALYQTITPLEVIVCDDGSTDDTIQKIKQRYPKAIKDGKLKLLEISHRGVSQARNKCLEIAKGSYISYLDSDNIWHPDHLIYLTYFLKCIKNYDIAYCTFKLFSERINGKIVPLKKFNYEELKNINFIDLNCIIHHRKLFEKFGGFDNSLSRFVDWKILLKFTKPELKTRIIAVNIATVNYWTNKTYLSNISKEENYNDLMKIYQFSKQ